MGGFVSIGVRRKDNTFTTHAIWTNTLPPVMQSEIFRNGDISPLEMFIGKFSNKLNGSRVPQQYHIPSEFGYILVDDIEKKIIEWNGFGELFTVDDSKLGFTSDMPSAVSLKQRQYLANAVSVATYLSPSEGSYVNIDVSQPLDQSAYDDVIARIQSNENLPSNNSFLVSFLIDVPGWKVDSLPLGKRESAEKMMAAITERTPLNGKEIGFWEKELSSYPGSYDSAHKKGF